MLSLFHAQQELVKLITGKSLFTVQFDRLPVKDKEINHFLQKTSSKFAYQVESMNVMGGTCIWISSHKVQ